MLLAEAGCVFMGFILYISGIHGRANSFCALKGSSVDLHCSAERPTSGNKWYTVQWDGYKYVQNELSVDGNHLTYKMSEESTLMINDLSESDENKYCCRENADNPQRCRSSSIELHVADLQVKVIPNTEGQTVTLICNTSCPLTENPAVYMWYKNRELLYQDWSPWYQQLVSSEEAVTYSCAIKGYEHLRAPEVSVDSVTSTCFTVTYAKGTMCSYKQLSEDEPCSITYPREVHIQRTPADEPGPVKLTCSTSCPLVNSKTAYRWYRGGNSYRHIKSQQFSVPRSSDTKSSCAVKGLEDLRSAEVCPDDKNCWSVNYVSRRICALEGSSLNISSVYTHPKNQEPQSKLWYKIKRSSEEDAQELIKAAGRVWYHDKRNSHTLSITNLKENDSAEYRFRLQQDDKRWTQSDFPGVTVTVTGLKVKFTPSAEVTEDQRVTLTCSTSCPLTDNTNYIWFLNRRPLTLTEDQNKHLVLDPVSTQHAGNYSCAVKTQKGLPSPEETLTVQSKTGKWTPAAAAGVCAALLLLIPLTVFLWIRRKRASSQPPQTETSGNTEQMNSSSLYDEISAQPREQDDLHYSRVHFSTNQTDPLDSTVKRHPPQQMEHVHYVVVNFRQSRIPA